LPAGASCSFNPTAVTFDGTNNATTVMTVASLANMAVPTGAQTVTITPSNSAGVNTTVSLTVNATTESFTLTSPNANFTIAAGATATVPLTVDSSTGFIIGSSNTTALPLTYSCSGLPSESNCNFSPSGGQLVSATAVTLSITTTPPTAQLHPPLERGQRFFYALLLPGLFGLMFASGSRTRTARLLSLIIVLGFSTLWMGACGGSNTSPQKNAGTTPGMYSVVVSATTGGANPLTSTFTVNLTVTAN
jgi:hypothetical protein